MISVLPESIIYSLTQTVFMLKRFFIYVLRVDKCRFMTSKKRPLWLVWGNADERGPPIQIMYKNGDGKNGKNLL